MPALREECQSTSKCAPLAKHFAHCQEKVEGGEGYKGEDCVEEMYVSPYILTVDVLFIDWFVRLCVFLGVSDALLPSRC